jgi:hypothetical protein
VPAFYYAITAQKPGLILSGRSPQIWSKERSTNPSWNYAIISLIPTAPEITNSFRANPAFAHRLNIPGIFTGKIINRENIGKSSTELVEKYMTENGPAQTGY